ncbi:MAG: hypothetical protein ACHQAX_04050 [Gammaproteobacteria bacterium]
MKDNPIETICRAGIALVKEHATLFSLETALAKQSIIPFVASLGCALVLIISTWFTLLALTAYTIYIQSQNVWLSLTGTLLLQILLLCLTGFMTHQFHQRMQFKETRSHLKDYFGSDHEH